MTNKDNAYGNLLEIIRDEGGGRNSAPFFIGTVVQSNPLIIKIGDIQIERKNIKINQDLLAGTKKQMSLAATAATGSTASTSGGSGDASFASHSHGQSTIGIQSGTFTSLDALKAGDEVAVLMSADMQQYIVLCKVV